MEKDIEGRGIKDPRVLDALRCVPRERFVSQKFQSDAHADRPLPIGHGQTISQPYMVALMTELAKVKSGDKVLEVGTGSGYQTAILAKLANHVYTIEIIKDLGDRAETLLHQDLGIKNISFKIGDGYEGWPEFSPFDAIVVTAAPDHVPPKLLEQLKPGGRLIIPVGSVKGHQELMRIEKTPDGRTMHESIIPVRFVPFTGDHGLK